MLLLPESLKRTELRRGWESSAMISPPNGFPRRSLSSSSSKSSSSSCMELGSSRSCGNEILNQRSSSGEKTFVKGKKVSVGTNNNRMVSHSKWPILSITLKFHDYSAVLKSWLPMFSADIKPFGIMASRSKRPLHPPASSTRCRKRNESAYSHPSAWLAPAIFFKRSGVFHPRVANMATNPAMFRSRRIQGGSRFTWQSWEVRNPWCSFWAGPKVLQFWFCLSNEACTGFPFPATCSCVLRILTRHQDNLGYPLVI